MSFNKIISIILLCFVISIFTSPPAQADEPLPPSELIDWLDYALKRFPPNDCPHLEKGVSKCAGITHLDLVGNIKKGSLQATFTGYNWSRKDQTVDLISPSSSFSLTNSKIVLTEQLDPMANDSIFISPYFETSGGYWKVTIPPGKFVLKTTLTFLPQSVIPVNLAQDIGRVNGDRLTGGILQFDENEGNHGGSVQLILEGKKEKTKEKPQIRGTRIFAWDSIPTFTYVVSVSGLKSEAPISFPLLSDENIEKVIPNKSYRIHTKDGVRYLETTFSPSQTKLTIKGHYKTKPTKFTLGNSLPFEIWLYVASRRYPVNIQTNTNPIDPSEFSHLTDTRGARAFLVKPGQKLAFYPIVVKVDEGRKGKGNIQYSFFEGSKGYWLEKLFLTAKVLDQDRLIIPTPSTPTYAGIGNDGIEMYHDKDNQLSVRLPRGGLNSEQIKVDWYSKRNSNAFFTIFKAALPGQNVHLEEQNIDIHFRPGHVPLIAWGANIIDGGLIDQFHLYGFLIGILAFFICRGLKFRYPLSALVTFLFIGLYQVDNFPIFWVLITLIFTLPFARLNDDFFETLKTKNVKRTLIIALLVIIYGVTSFYLANYSRDRIYSALHPYADQNSIFYFDGQTRDNKELRKAKMDFTYNKSLKGAPSSMGYDEVEDIIDIPSAAPQQQYQQNVAQLDNRLIKASEWTATPVSIKNFVKGGQTINMTSNNIASGTNTKIGVFTAGPVIRAVWLLIETLLILWLMVAILQRTRRLFGIK